MWFLLLILLATVPGANKVTVLNTFYTYEACQPERNRIGFAMAESYPYENDFIIVCNFRDNGHMVSFHKLPRYGASVKEALFQQADVAPVTRLTGPPVVVPGRLSLKHTGARSFLGRAADTAAPGDVCEKRAAVYCANHPSITFHKGSIEHVEGNSLPIPHLSLRLQ